MQIPAPPARPEAILIATTNAGKLHEIRHGLAGLPVRWRSLGDFPGMEAPIEDGATFEENAAKKASYYARRTGIWALADDSGLEVEALGGEPGVWSARYAGPGARDAANNQKLIRALAAVPSDQRQARFRCVMALASPTGIATTTTGTVEGLILDEPRGRNGFGYDPHFFVPGLGKTLAELASSAKNEISHRGKALRILRSWLIQNREE